MNCLVKKSIFILLILLICNCSENQVENIISQDSEVNIEDPRKITILYTNDEHGWVEKSDNSNGAANLMGIWKNYEGYNRDKSFLILSGGDNWLGPPISNQFKGESIVDVMNSMEYDAAAIGNHEFEFGVYNLYNRVEQANYKYLSANIRKKDTGEIPNFATPYIIKEMNGIMVGIIGLTTISTPNQTVKEYVKNYEFIDYVTALEETVPLAKEDGAEILILLAHVCYTELLEMSDILIDMGISVAGGGHCHREMSSESILNSGDEFVVVQASPWMHSYSKVEILYDILGKRVIKITLRSQNNEEDEPDALVKNVVQNWRNKME